MALSKEELSLIGNLRLRHYRQRSADLQMRAYWRGAQTFDQLGMMVPPTMRHFRVVANWPRVVVNTRTRRQQVRSLIMPGQEIDDPDLRLMWDSNNLDRAIRKFNVDRDVFGRSFLAGFDNPVVGAEPIIRPVSPLEMAVIIEDGEIVAAARFYGGRTDEVPGSNPRKVSLYLPDRTVWADKGSGGWVETGRDEHNLGRLPIVMDEGLSLTGEPTGESAMTDIIPMTDSAARALTNLQFGVDSHGLPRLWSSGVSRGDFVNKDGTVQTRWEQYFNNVWAIKDPQGKLGSVQASDLKNFDTALEVYGKQASTVTGFPARYFGLTSVNPPSADAIRADEAELVSAIEDQNTATGVVIGWALALGWKIKTGEWLDGDRIHVEWHDPATPTVAQRTDATVKMFQSGIVSREGAWDELGWSEPRKDRERKYLEQEARAGMGPVNKDPDAGFGA